MKIGILTLPFNNNYGGYLQAYALMTVLKREGFDVELIYRRNNRWSKIHIVKLIIKNLAKLLKGDTINSIIPNQEEGYQTRGELQHLFVDKYIVPRTVPIYSTPDLYSLISRHKYNYIIVGSDQVWRPDYGQKHVQDFFLSELDNDIPNRISYAASFGSNNLVFSQKENMDCKKGIYNFKAISVREDSAKQLIYSFGWKTPKDIVTVLDPTLLLDGIHYLELLPKKQCKEKHQLFCYILDGDNTKYEIIDTVSQRFKCLPYLIIDPENWRAPQYVMPSIEDWLSGIRDADFVITDSYHGMLFSVILGKPFVVIANYSRGIDRFISFLKKIELENRIVCNVDDVNSVLGQRIDWNRTNMLLANERRRSINFLKDNLK